MKSTVFSVVSSSIVFFGSLLGSAALACDLNTALTTATSIQMVTRAATGTTQVSVKTGITPGVKSTTDYRFSGLDRGHAGAVVYLYLSGPGFSCTKELAHVNFDFAIPNSYFSDPARAALLSTLNTCVARFSVSKKDTSIKFEVVAGRVLRQAMAITEPGSGQLNTVIDLNNTNLATLTCF